MAEAGPSPFAIALRISSVAVRQMPSSIGSVEFSMKKSAECSTKPRPVSAGALRQLDQIRRRDDLELDQQVGEVDVGGELIDDDAHRAFGRVGTHINDA